MESDRDTKQGRTRLREPTSKASAISSKPWSVPLGDRERADNTLRVTAPYDGELLAELELSNAAHVERCLDTAYRLFRNRDAWLPLPERIGILERTARIMLRERIPLAMTATQEGGKPLLDSEFEVERAIDCVRLCVEILRTESGSVIPMDGTRASAHRLGLTQREPVGVVVAVSAFNHPLNVVVRQAAAAVAAGCPVIVKPSPATPLSCLYLSRIFREAGLPAEWCQVVITDQAGIAEALVTDARVGFLSFVGSPAVGWKLRSRLSPGTRCTLQHGGAAPVILLEDADRKSALDSLVKGSFYHAGQDCVSVQRIFAPRTQAQDFASDLALSALALKLGDPKNSATDVGPLIRPAEAERVHTWVQEAIAGGAERLSGGAPIGRSLYEPTVLFDPPGDAKVSRLEIFGPVVCVYGYDSLEEAVIRANELPFAFQASVYTTDLDLALRVYRRIDASAVMVNDDPTFRIEGMPFAGLRQSGLGEGGVPQLISAMQIEKMLVLHSREL